MENRVWNIVSAIISIYVLQICAAGGASPCPQGWVLYVPEKTCYKIIPTKGSWEEARAACINENATLIELHTEDEFQFVLTYIQAQDSSVTEFFIGAAETDVTGTFAWNSSGEVLTSSQFSAWAAFQPDNYGNNQNCIGLWALSSGGVIWDDVNCMAKRYPVCEHNKTASGAACTPGAETTDRCYEIANGSNTYTWHGSRDYCHARGGCLAEVMSQEEWDAIRYNIDTNDFYWIGGSDEEEEGNFTWSDSGVPIVTRHTYSPWIPGRPNQYGINHCVSLKLMFKGTPNEVAGMVDSDCNNKRLFICQTPADTGVRPSKNEPFTLQQTFPDQNGSLLLPFRIRACPSENVTIHLWSGDYLWGHFVLSKTFISADLNGTVNATSEGVVKCVSDTKLWLWLKQTEISIGTACRSEDGDTLMSVRLENATIPEVTINITHNTEYFYVGLQCDTPCPSNYIWRDDLQTCYGFTGWKWLKWHEARDFCLADGATLLVINSQAEQDAIEEDSPSFMIPKRGAWTGGTDDHCQGDFRWMDNCGPLNSTFTKWGRNEPRNCWFDHCTAMWQAGSWTTTTCDQFSIGICEYHPGHVPSACPTWSCPAEDHRKLCPDGWLRFSSSCYKAVDSAYVSLYGGSGNNVTSMAVTAASACLNISNSEGGLVTIESTDEATFIFDNFFIDPAALYLTAGVRRSRDKTWTWGDMGLDVPPSFSIDSTLAGNELAASKQELHPSNYTGVYGPLCEMPTVYLERCPCDIGNPCWNGGSCKWGCRFDQDPFSCECPNKYTGKLCEQDTRCSDWADTPDTLYRYGSAHTDSCIAVMGDLLNHTQAGDACFAMNKSRLLVTSDPDMFSQAEELLTTRLGMNEIGYWVDSNYNTVANTWTSDGVVIPNGHFDGGVSPPGTSLSCLGFPRSPGMQWGRLGDIACDTELRYICQLPVEELLCGCSKSPCLNGGECTCTCTSLGACDPSNHSCACADGYYGNACQFEITTTERAIWSTETTAVSEKNSFSSTKGSDLTEGSTLPSAGTTLPSTGTTSPSTGSTSPSTGTTSRGTVSDTSMTLNAITQQMQTTSSTGITSQGAVAVVTSTPASLSSNPDPTTLGPLILDLTEESFKSIFDHPAEAEYAEVVGSLGIILVGIFLALIVAMDSTSIRDQYRYFKENMEDARWRYRQWRSK